MLAATPGPRVKRRAIHHSLSLPSEHGDHRRDSIPQRRLAREFKPLSQQQMAALTEKTESVSSSRCFSAFANEPEHPESRHPSLSRFVRRVGFADWLALSANRRGQPLPQTKALREQAGVGGLDDNQG